jgi:hypothetical protein
MFGLIFPEIKIAGTKDCCLFNDINADAHEQQPK